MTTTQDSPPFALRAFAPSREIAVDPLAYHPAIDAQRRRQVAERLNSMEHLVCKILAPLERAQAAGRTEENLAPIVAQWAGPLAKWVQIERLKTQGAGPRTLHIRCANPALIHALRPRLPELINQLTAAGVTQVKL
jgi:hypothetical protein